MRQTMRRKIEYCGPTHLSVQTTQPNNEQNSSTTSGFEMMDRMIDNDRREYRRRIVASYTSSYLEHCTFDNISSRYDTFRKNYPTGSFETDAQISAAVEILTRGCRHVNKQTCAEHYSNLLRKEPKRETKHIEGERKTRVANADFISILHEVSTVGVRKQPNDDTTVRNIKILKKQLLSTNPNGLGYLMDAFQITEDSLTTTNNDLYRIHKIDSRPGAFERRIARQLNTSDSEITVIKKVVDRGTTRKIVIPEPDRILSPNEATSLYRTGSIARDSNKHSHTNLLAKELTIDNELIQGALETSNNYDEQPELKQKYILHLREAPQMTYLKRYSKYFSIVCDKQEIVIKGIKSTKLQEMSNTELFVLFCLIEQLNVTEIDIRHWNPRIFKNIKFFTQNLLLHNNKELMRARDTNFINTIPPQGSNFNKNRKR